MSLFPQNVLEHAQSQAVAEYRMDFERVMALPRRAPLNCDRTAGEYSIDAQALAEYVTEQYALPRRGRCKCKEQGYQHCIDKLNPVQAWTLREAKKIGGAIGMIPVGGGKTFTGILMPLAIPDCKVAVLLAKPDQRIHYWKAYLRLREHFRVPSFVFDKLDDEYGAIVTGAPVLHFVPYSLLSQAKSTALLERMNPDLIICDEAHSVSARTSSRTNRLLRYLADVKNQVRFCAWSGTLVKKSVRDQAHLMSHALGVGSPMPLDPDDVEAWAAVFDPSPVPDTETQTAIKLYGAFDRGGRQRKWYERGGVNEGVRQGYREHVLATPGVISTRESSVGCSLPFHQRVIKLPDEVRNALTNVRTLMKRPDGEELVEATEIAACARNVASGFYYYWAFPGIPCTCGPNVFVEEMRCEHCQFINEWYKRRTAWNKELRQKLQHFEVHLDSPMLCTNAAMRAYQDEPYVGDLPVWHADTWRPWAAIKDDVQYVPRVKWIDDFFACDAAQWATEHRGVVWCQSSAFGRKVAELAGIAYHGGGPQAEANILAEKGDRSIVASLKAHGTGRDGLQLKFREQYFAEPPASGETWQQALGRLARPGQEADSVETWVARHSDEVRDALENAIRDAEFIESVTGNKQLLLAADFSFDWRRAP